MVERKHFALSPVELTKLRDMRLNKDGLLVVTSHQDEFGSFGASDTCMESSKPELLGISFQACCRGGSTFVGFSEKERLDGCNIEDLRFAMFLHHSGELYVYENGSQVLKCHLTYNVSDVVQIVTHPEDGLRYYLNSNLLYVSCQSPRYPMHPAVRARKNSVLTGTLPVKELSWLAEPGLVVTVHPSSEKPRDDNANSHISLTCISVAGSEIATISCEPAQNARWLRDLLASQQNMPVGGIRLVRANGQPLLDDEPLMSIVA